MAGRPSKFRPEFVEQARNYCLLGATDIDLAKFFAVSKATINVWKQDYPAFSAALLSKDIADAKVAASLFDRANGYSHEDVDIRVVGGKIVKTKIIKHYPPDTAAAIFWMKNRQGWRDKVDHELSGKDGGPVQYQAVERRIVDPKAE